MWNIKALYFHSQMQISVLFKVLSFLKNLGDQTQTLTKHIYKPWLLPVWNIKPLAGPLDRQVVSTSYSIFPLTNANFSPFQSTVSLTFFYRSNWHLDEAHLQTLVITCVKYQSSSPTPWYKSGVHKILYISTHKCKV